MAYRLAHASITTEQARAVVTSLTATDNGTRLQTWPELLRLLRDWVNKLHGAASGLQHGRPLRPWEHKAQQQPVTAVTQQAQQQQAGNFQLLQEAVTAVIAALNDAAAAKQSASGDVSQSATNELLAILAPALSFLASAVTAAAGLITAGGSTAVQHLQTTAIAASCSATSAAMPAVLTAADLAVLPAVLSSYQQLTLSYKDNPQRICWSVSCLLASLQDALPAALMQLMAAASVSSTPASAASATLQDWADQQTQEYVVTCVIGQLAGLYTLGHAVGLATCRAAAAACASVSFSSSSSSSVNSMQGGNTAESSVLQGFAGVSRLLQSGCSQTGEPATTALSAAMAAGLLAGSLEVSSGVVAPAPAASAAVAGPMSDVWASAMQQGQRQQQQQYQEAFGVQDPSSIRSGWQLDLQQQQLLLLQAVDLACQRIWDAAASSPAAAAAAEGGGTLGHGAVSTAGFVQLLGYAYSRIMANHSHAVQQLQLQQSIAGIQCSLRYSMRQCCGLSGLMHFAGCCSDPAAANAWLAAQQQQHSPQEVGLLARWLADAVRSLQGEQLLLLLLQAVRSEAETAADSYDCYLHVTKPELLQQVDAAAVRQQLDRLFATVVSVLAAVWQQQQQQQQAPNAQSSASAPIQGGSSSSSGDPNNAAAAVVAEGLSTLAALQFCQLQLPAYVDLLRGLVGTLASSTSAADAFLAHALPCYNALVHMVDHSGSSSSEQRQCMESECSTVDCGCSSSRNALESNSTSAGQQCMTGSTVECECGSVSNSDHATAGSSSSSSAAQPWLTRPVLIARLSFLLPLIPVACKATSNQAAAAARVLPLVLLLLPHPVRQLSEAAHSAFAGLLTAAVEKAAAAAASAWDQQQQQQDPALTVLQQAIPFYLQRSLEGLPHSGSLEGLAISFSCILKQLPAGDVMSLLAVTNITDCAATWARQAAAEGQPVVHAPVRSRQRDGAVDMKSNPGTQGPVTAGDSSRSSTPAAVAAARLCELVQLSLQLVHYRLLPSVLQHIAAVVEKADVVVQQQWIQGLYAACIANDDYARKPALIQWIDGLNKDILQVWRRHDAASRNAHKKGDTSSDCDGGHLAM